MAATEQAGGRERILLAARRLFAESGYRGLSMREIADAAGVTKAALYYHFRDKEALFVAVIHAMVQEFGAMAAAAQLGAPTQRAAIEQIVCAIMAQPPEQKALTQLVSQELYQLAEAHRAVLVEEYHRLFLAKLHEVLARGVEAGEFRTLDPVVTTWALLGMLQPFFAPTTMGRASRTQTPEVVVELLRIFFDGIGQQDEYRVAVLAGVRESE